MDSNKKSVIVFGASGLIGNQLLQLLLTDNRYNKIILPLRKPIDITHPKVQQIIFDFDNPPYHLLIADDVFCCLGTTIKTAKSKDAFYKVDYTYVTMVATECKNNGIKQFGVVSSIGANKNSSSFYLNTKGKTEETISLLNFQNTCIYKPSALLGNRDEFRLIEKISLFVMTLFSFLVPKKYKAIHAKQVAKAMVWSFNSNKNGVNIFENNDLLNV